MNRVDGRYNVFIGRAYVRACVRLSVRSGLSLVNQTNFSVKCQYLQND